ncbi:LemA family protein [Pseudomonas sp.]|uniref:LemA family protein n=1 Tax=Pseudomonas sp. TaxID=306 RepID=UPI003CC6D3EA
MTVSTLMAMAAGGAVTLYLIRAYNRLVTLRNQFKNAFAQIEVQLKRRYDLIPNLVETAKGYLNHERATLEAVVAARNHAVTQLHSVTASAGDAHSMAQLASSEASLGAALSRLNVTVEAYPDLKASANMQQLSEELSSTENKLAFARQAYNDAVMAYNSYKHTFPPVLLAATFGHGSDAAYLEFADSAAMQTAPSVSF